MVEERPTAAYVLSLIGGVFIILGGIVFMLLGRSFSYYYGFTMIFLIMGVIGLILGVVIILGAVLAYGNANQRSTWGIVIVILSIISLIVNMGGFILGFILSLVGGILFMTWKPTFYPYAATRMCFGCGRHVPATYPACPFCGTQVPAQIPYQQAYPHQAAGVPQQVAQPYYGQPPATPAPVTPGTVQQFCTSCGESLPPGVRYCPKCGAAVQQ